MRLSYEEQLLFQTTVWDFYHEHSRSMPWRDNPDPYYVLVSELMLQQTQVDRVIPKFNAFIEVFPDVNTLSGSSLADVLVLWNGLGYNRRAKFLYESAKMINSQYGGTIPDSKEELIKLPGVGPNTAGAILAYGFNQTVSFIETNIRTVYFHHFFPYGMAVSDSELMDIVDQTVDSEHPREWYWALMDYGAFLKKQGSGRNSISAHYKKQSALKGSIREVRGQIVKALTKDQLTLTELKQEVMYDERFNAALEGLLKEGLVSKHKELLYLTK